MPFLLIGFTLVCYYLFPTIIFICCQECIFPKPDSDELDITLYRINYINSDDDTSISRNSSISSIESNSTTNSNDNLITASIELSNNINNNSENA